MTEEITTPKFEHSPTNYTGRMEKLNFYSFNKTDAKAAEYKRIKDEVEGKLARGEPVYVSFHDPRREHSVGRIKSVNIKWEEHQRRSSWYSTNSSLETYVYAGFDDIEVVWDGRKNKVKPRANEITYLPDWQHGTQWDWEQTVTEKEPAVIAYDHLGQQLEVGQFVCFVHRSYGNISMKFGQVTRFTPKGSVFVKTTKLRDGQRAGEELKAFSMDDVVIVNDALMKRLVMAKLAAN